MSAFQNIYYKRTAATAKACYMCFRPTTTVLATANTVDFIYVCDGHLTDRGFATLIEPPADDQAREAKKVSDEEIRRVKEEWEEKQRRKQEKAKEAEKDKEKDKEVGKNEKGKSVAPNPPPPPAPIPVPGSAAAAKPAHQRYTLHRDVWVMRLTEHRKRRQTTAVKEVAPRLPITPRGGVA